MSSPVLNFINKITNFRNRKVDRHKLTVFIFFLVLSTIFWFLNALSKNYTATISCPIRFVELPKNKILVGELPSDLSLKVNAYGFALLKYNMSKSLLPVNISVNPNVLNYIKNSDSTLFYMLSDNSRERISNQLNSEIRIIDISPDSVYFQFAKVQDKKVAIIQDFEVNYRKQFINKDKIRLVPDSIFIIGVKETIDTIKSVKTIHQEFSDIYKTTTKRIKLQTIPGIDFSDNEVEMTIPVEKYTEGNLTLRIETINVPKRLSLKTFPNKVKISYLAGLSEYNTIIPEQFKAIVDFKDIDLKNNDLSEKVKVQIIKKPDNIIPGSLDYSPSKVEYIIEK